MENIPEKIYLQICEDADETITDFNELYQEDITWCADRIHDNDIEYVRVHDADLNSAASPFNVVRRCEQLKQRIFSKTFNKRGD